MEARQKELYESPCVIEVEIKTGRIVCVSQQDYLYGGLDE